MSKAKTIKKNEKVILPKPQKPQVGTKKFPIPQEEINELKKYKEGKIIFSFRFLDLTHEAFNLGGICINWVNDLFFMLRDVSKITKKQLLNELYEHYRPHAHDWSKLDYDFGFDEDFYEQVECRQIRIAKSKGGIHGFLIGNIFYIVWLDPHHNLYPDENYGGRKFFKPPQTCCSYRDGELIKLKEENDKLRSEISTYEELLDTLSNS
ncbi:hypothetical protein [Caldanaerobius polysaccharolyticus]|uniref:hypothetical protein n=1 Tax=Caldanaerobius polysaccharolyticus TaxID=44256 RepID=UPI000558FA57|nr:hypothetical protein [Caldanaerobius polysaccharolyticus]